MAIITTSGITRPNQQNQAGPIDALTIEEFNGVVREVIERRSKLAPYITKRKVVGTDTLTQYAIGDTQLGVLKPGEAPDGTPHSFSKVSVQVEVTIIARNIVPLLEDIQNNFGARQKLAGVQGKKIARLDDQSLMIQGIKAARLTNSPYSNVAGDKPEGFAGGSVVKFAAAADAKDPAKLYAKISEVLVAMEHKDVIPQDDGIICIVRPDEFYTLQQAEQIVNGEYLTSDGNKLTGVPQFKAWGIPVVSSMNLPREVITGHQLSTPNNGNAFDGDFTKVVALFVAPDAILAGESIPLQSDIWWDKMTKQWFIDTWISFTATPDRTEYAATLELP